MHAHGVDTTANDLRQVPYDVVLAEHVLHRPPPQRVTADRRGTNRRAALIAGSMARRWSARVGDDFVAVSGFPRRRGSRRRP